jgi:hypothetical protein
MEDNPPVVSKPNKTFRNLLILIAGSGLIAFGAGLGLDISDTVVATAKDALNSGVEALIASMLSAAGIVGLKTLTK